MSAQQALPPLQNTDLAHGAITWREAGQGLPLLLLHGIGSGSGSWRAQLDAMASTHRVIAWDAPGYGSSGALPMQQPLALDYARALDLLLDALNVEEAIVLGHSLGAIMAAAWCATTTRRVRGLLLASPARGYATANEAVRQTKFRERIDLVSKLGVEGMAAQRSAALCAPQASAQAVAAVRENMARVTPEGYAQAAWMLANDDLMGHLRQTSAHTSPPLAVLCGELDRTTPPEACERIAAECGAPFVRLSGVAHACYVEDPAQFNSAIGTALSQEVTHG